MAQAIASLFVEIGAKIDKLQKGADGAVSTLLRTEKNISRTMGKINSIVNAALVVGGVVAIKKFSDALQSLAAQGEKVGSIEEAFKKLGGSASSLEAARKSTIGLVSAFDLMAIANQGMLSKLPQFNENFGKIAELGARLANTLGTDTKEAIQQVTQAIESGKTKQLAALGITVNADKAYRDFAASLGVSEDKLNDLGKRTAIQTAAMKELEAATERLAPVTDSVGNAQEAVNTAWKDGLAVMGKAVNENEALRDVYREIEQALQEVDWQQVGRDLAYVASVVGDLVVPALKLSVDLINDFVNGMKLLSQLPLNNFSIDEAAQAVAELEAGTRNVNAFAKAIKGLNELKGITVFSGDKFALTGEGLKKAAAAIQEIEEAMGESGEVAAKYREQLDAIKLNFKNWSQLVEEAPISEPFIKGAEEAEKLSKKIKELDSDWQKFIADTEKNSLETAIEKSIATLDRASFDSFSAKLGQSIEDEFVSRFKDTIALGVKTEGEVRAQARKAAEIQVGEYSAQFDKASRESAERLAEHHRKAYEDSVGFWSDTFRNALDGSATSLEDSLKDLLVGFASALAASVSDGLEQGLTKGGAEGIGQMLGDLIGGQGGGGGGGFLDQLGSMFGFGQTTADAHAAGIQGPGLADGSFPSGGASAGSYAAAGAASAISVITSALNAKETDRQYGDNRGTGAAVGGGIGTAIGSIGGPAGMMVGQQVGSMVGSLIGSLFGRGATHAQTKAREAFGEFIEDSFDKLKTIAFFDAKDKLQTLDAEKLNFVVGGSGRFNNPDWGASMSDWGEEAKTTFLGLGEALEEVLGITEDVGGQMGFLLGDNLIGNIDNARMLVYQLGLSLEDMEAALVSAGLSGEMSWHEVEVNLQGVNNAFQAGLVGIGDLSGAVDELIGSGGRGAAAIKSVKDIAVEALEAGAKTIADLPAFFAQAGVSQEMIDAIMTSIENRGIKTLEELAAVSDRVGGGIVADIQSNSTAMQQTWKEMADAVKEVQQQLNDLPERLQTDVTINVKANISDEAQGAIDAINQGGDAINVGNTAYASGGVIPSRTKFAGGIAGEAGMEAILPLRTMPNGKLGVEGIGGKSSNAATIVINAQGAGPGVENLIRQEIEAMGQMAISTAIQAAQDLAGRGGRYADY